MGIADISRIDFRLYLVTDSARAGKRGILSILEEALRGGVKAIQIREKMMGGRALLSLALNVREITSRFNAKLFVNDRIDVAIASRADGVHLSERSVPVSSVREGWRHLLIGRSVHSPLGAVHAEDEGADFITFGPVFHTPSKEIFGAPLGVDMLRDVTERVHIPVFAIGGVKPGNTRRCLNEGNAHGVALISGIVASPYPESEARNYLEIIKGREEK